MILLWNKERYQKVDTLVSITLLACIAWFMYAWYFDVLPISLLTLTILPVGLAHWSKRKLEKLLKVFGGAHISVDEKKLTLSKPNQNYEAIVWFKNITSVKSSHWLFMEKMILSLKGDKEVMLINFRDQKLLLNKINAL